MGVCFGERVILDVQYLEPSWRKWVAMGGPWGWIFLCWFWSPSLLLGLLWRELRHCTVRDGLTSLEPWAKMNNHFLFVRHLFLVTKKLFGTVKKNDNSHGHFLLVLSFQKVLPSFPFFLRVNQTQRFNSRFQHQSCKVRNTRSFQLCIQMPFMGCWIVGQCHLLEYLEAKTLRRPGLIQQEPNVPEGKS